MATLVKKKTRPAPWTQMKRGIKPRSQRQNPPKKPNQRKRIRPISRARAKQMRDYIKQAAAFLKSKGWCARCSLRGTDIHHMRGRLGPLLTDERHWVVLCRTCHDWVHGNPRSAQQVGLLDLENWEKP